MSEDVSTPVPDQPGQDPEAPQQTPVTDGYGFSDSPDAGYDLGHEGPAEPSGTAQPGDGTDEG